MKKDFLKKFQSYVDGTYDVETGSSLSYEDGYQASFERETIKYSKKGYLAKIEEGKNLSSNKVVHAGVYHGNVEVSFHFNNLADAMAYAKKYNQEAILDWKQFKKGNMDKAFIANPYFQPEK